MELVITKIRAISETSLIWHFGAGVFAGSIAYSLRFQTRSDSLHFDYRLAGRILLALAWSEESPGYTARMAVNRRAGATTEGDV